MPNVLETLVVKFEGDNRDFSRAVDEAKGKTSLFSSMAQGAMMGVGMAAANMAVQAAGAFVDFTREGVGMASDLAETLSKVGVVFGDSAEEVKTWGKDAATALGQSQAEALSAAATFGNLFVSMGMATGPAADMSMNIVQLASDLASFNNIDPSIALEKLRAGLVGEAEPLRALGVNINAAMVQEKALAMGLAETTDALTPAMLAQARYALILEQTTTAQGDFARTSDGLANQQRIADAQWKELKTTIGTALLPVVTALTAALNKLLRDVLPPLTDMINNKITPAFKAIADAVGPAINFVMGMFRQMGETMRTQTDGPLAYLKQWFDQNMPRIQLIVERVLGAIQAFWSAHGETIMNIVRTYLEWMMRFWDTVMRTILDVVTIALQLLTGDFEGAGRTLQGILGRWQGLAQDAIRAMVNAIVDGVRNVDWGGIGRGIIEGIARGIRDAGNVIKDAARDAAQRAYDAARSWLHIGSPSRLAAEDIGKPFAEGIGVGIRDGMRKLAADMGSSLDLMMGQISPDLAGAGAPAGSATASITQNFYGNAEPAGVGAASLSGVREGLRATGRG